MTDTSLKIDTETRARLKTLAEARGVSMRDLVAGLAEEAEQAQALDTATAHFRRAISEPGVAEQFDRDFGGRPAKRASRAA
jgi:predicted DNA-binding ribbon-helix-helix protein